MVTCTLTWDVGMPGRRLKLFSRGLSQMALLASV